MNKVKKAAALFVVCGCALTVWTVCCENEAHYSAGVQRENIEGILQKEEWDQEDCSVLAAQTGLAPAVLHAMKQQGRAAELLALQELYFRPVIIKCEPNSLISKEEYVADEQGNPTQGMAIPYVEDGDILITFCSHAFGWRNGHAGIVIDAKRRLVLEAQVLGMPSMIASLDRWEQYPSFAVMRLKDASAGTRSAVADYAYESLAGISYHLTAGIKDTFLKKELPEKPGGTQCAHLVWYAYARFGYQLDSDGGLIVTPRDIYNSELLTVIQRYGFRES